MRSRTACGAGQRVDASISWAVAMTMAIIIIVGGLVILESGRMRIAGEYETALEAKSATAQLSSLAAEERAFALKPYPAYEEHFDQAAARVRRAAASLDAYYHASATTPRLRASRKSAPPQMKTFARAARSSPNWRTPPTHRANRRWRFRHPTAARRSMPRSPCYAVTKNNARSTRSIPAASISAFPRYTSARCAH